MTIPQRPACHIKINCLATDVMKNLLPSRMFPHYNEKYQLYYGLYYFFIFFYCLNDKGTGAGLLPVQQEGHSMN